MVSHKKTADFIRSNKAKDKLKQYVDEAADAAADKIEGKGVDVHKAIGKLPKPKDGWTLPGHKYTGPYNDLSKQLKYDKNTGEILEIYQ